MYLPQPLWGEVYEVPSTMTADDLLRLPDDGSSYELFEGVVVREMTAPGHGGVCHRLSLELGIYARATGFAHQIVQNALFDLTPPASPRKTILAPDVAILRTNTALPWNVPKETPLLAVEVVSESQSLAELAIKAQFYRNVGVDEVWIIDHQTRIIEQWNVAGKTTFAASATLTSDLLPGFSVAEAFLLDG